MEVPLINEALFKENSPVTANVDITDLVPYILIVQKMYLKPILGLPLYNELQTQIKAATTTPPPEVNPITPANRALIIEIAPTLSYYATYQGLPFHWAKIVNKGITVRESENSGAINIDDLAQLRRWIKDDAERLAHDLIGYLCSCGLYPLWTPAPGYGCYDHSFTYCAPAREPSPGGDSTPDYNEQRARYSQPADMGIFIPRRRRERGY